MTSLSLDRHKKSHNLTAQPRAGASSPVTSGWVHPTSHPTPPHATDETTGQSDGTRGRGRRRKIRAPWNVPVLRDGCVEKQRATTMPFLAGEERRAVFAVSDRPQERRPRVPIHRVGEGRGCSSISGSRSRSRPPLLTEAMVEDRRACRASRAARIMIMSMGVEWTVGKDGRGNSTRRNGEEMRRVGVEGGR